MDQLAPAVSPAWPSKTIAYASLGLAAAASVDPARYDDLERVATTLRDWVPGHRSSWRWCEPRLTYDNARLPEALLRVGHRLQDDSLVERGAVLLQWLERLCRRGDFYRFPGHRGLDDVRQLTWSGDEQPLEATAMADAHHAWLDLSADPGSAAAIERAWSWFLGNNRIGEVVADVAAGAGFDGLGSGSVNKNRGAESTIAFHRCFITRSAARAAFTSDVTTSDEAVDA
jgi:hypothetical protein